MPLLPFHNYFGPGNDLNRGDPVDEDDRIAQEHDFAYGTALTSEDVSNADEKAKDDFWNDYDTTGNWHSLIGAIGLTVKLKLEKRIGVIYPDIYSFSSKYEALRLRKCLEEYSEHQIGNRQFENDQTLPSASRNDGQQGNNNYQETNQVYVSQQDCYMSPTDGTTRKHSNATLYVLTFFGSQGFLLYYLLSRTLKR